MLVVWGETRWSVTDHMSHFDLSVLRGSPMNWTICGSLGDRLVKSERMKFCDSKGLWWYCFLGALFLTLSKTRTNKLQNEMISIVLNSD